MAGVELATAYVSLVVSGDKVAPGVRKALGSADTEADRAGKSAGATFSSRFGGALKVGASLAGAFAAVQGVKLLKDSIGAASDLGESLNAVNVTFGKNAAGIKSLGEEAANAIGLSNTEFNGLAVQFSAFADIIAGKGGDVVGTMDELTTRGADFASVMNLDVAEAMRLFQSGLAGETEPLRKFGIDLSAAAVQAHAYEKGIAAAGEELTEQQKVQSRYSLLMQQTSKTQGDFKNTSDSLANAQRRLGAQWENLKAQLGQELLPVMEDVTNWFANEAVPKISRFVEQMQSGKGAGGEFADTLLDIKDAAKGAADFVGDVVGAFRDMPDWAQKMLAGGAAGAFAVSKLPGLGGLMGGNGGGILGKGPLPVFVTNPGFGVPGKGGPGVGGVPGKGGPATPGGKVGIGTGLGMLAGGAAGLNYDPSELGWEKLEGDIIKANRAFVEFAQNRTGFDNLTDAAKGLDQIIAGMTLTKPTQGFAYLQELANKTGLSMGDLRAILPATSKAIQEAGGRAKLAGRNTDDWKNSILGLGKETDRVDGKKPSLNWLFPGLEPGRKNTDGLGKDTDRVGRKKPNVIWSFPGMLAGIADALRLDNALDQAAQDRTSTITIRTNRIGGVTSSAGGRSVDGGLHTGGTAMAGRTYVVGERGPELFRPHSSGTVYPNHRLPSTGGGQVALTITNWRTGEGYMREIADGVLGDSADMAGMRGRAR